MKLLFIILLSTLFLWADTTPATAAERSAALKEQQQLIAEAKVISKHYHEFIDTPPSEKKKKLALAVKEEIETFQALHEDSKLLVPTLELLVEVDYYLDNTK